MSDGNVSYRVKKASRGRVSERVMTPLEALARLAAIVPPTNTGNDEAAEPGSPDSAAF